MFYNGSARCYFAASSLYSENDIWCVLSAGEVTAVMESFLKDNLLELREALWNNKFCITREGQGAFSGPHLGHFGAPAPFGPPISGEHSGVCSM
jgi:hypothetical protein